MRSWALSVAGVGLALGLGPLGCTVPVAQDLDEVDANRLVAALEQGGLESHKEPAADSNGRWTVTVSRQQASQAVALLAQENLPPTHSPGILDAMGSNSLVPSRSTEQARWVAGAAGELERSLGGVDGILSVRVHLAVPPREGTFSEPRAESPTASVLIRHRGPQLPLPVRDVQRLVAGAILGLDPERVTVVASVAVPRSPICLALPESPVQMSFPAWFAGALAVTTLASLGLAVRSRRELRECRGLPSPQGACADAEPVQSGRGSPP